MRSQDPGYPDIRSKRIRNYRVLRMETLKEIRCVFYELEHEPTGARHIHIASEDRENTFGVAFKTVPEDSTGVAHILEHTVLCGSKRFPVRDPFFSMLKRSLSTFMNAFTASDWTMYPFSTQNRKDFYNLMDVYLDAVFFPKLDALSFKQEGCRLEVESDKDGSWKLAYKGVVFNEMKGAMSSPDQVMVRSMLNALYPATTYRHNSGGDPREIPSLTHEHLIAFHRRHYHPSNAYFYTYGCLPLEDHLAFIDQTILSQFKRIDPGTQVASQPRWDRPRTVEYTYPLSSGEDASRKAQVSVAWLMSDIQDAFDVLALALLESILLGNAASPLRRALIDSGLGSALSDGTGFDADNRDTLFSCGLKDVCAEEAEKIEGIILGSLQELSDKGIERELIDAAIHQMEFHRKEVTNQPYPYGLKLLFSFFSAWIHGADPVRILRFDQDLQKIRREVDSGGFFEKLIRRYFLENSHRIRMILKPDSELEEKQNRHFSRQLDRIKDALNDTDRIRIQKDAETLIDLQESKENLSSLPTLDIEDIPPLTEVVRENAVIHPVSCYHRPTVGIYYFSAAMGAGALLPEQLPLVPFFCYAFSRCGTVRLDYAQMARRISADTGGLGMAAHALTRYDAQHACLPYAGLDAKCLVRNIDRMFEILNELIYGYRFSDIARLRNLLLEYRAGMEASVVRNGHRLAMSLAARNFSVSRRLSEIWYGIHHLETIKSMAQDISDASLEKLGEQLSDLGRALFSKTNVQVALIGEDSVVPGTVKTAQDLFSELPSSGDGFIAPILPTDPEPLREGWSTSSAVSFVVRAFETVGIRHRDSPALAVIGKMLRSLFLHREIREKGGAYGGFAQYSSEDGLFCLASYRDPHIVSTLDVFERASDFIRRPENYGAEDVKESILQVCSDIDRPDAPGASARKAFVRKLVGLTDEIRQEFKQKLLTLTPKQIAEAAQRHFSCNRPASVAVISGESQLAQANSKLVQSPLKLRKI
ncbi:MAG: insulinase family protein [Desulfobacterales bacterium]|nr:insulinase family protein [Desulfobacterales bacterium]